MAVVAMIVVVVRMRMPVGVIVTIVMVVRVGIVGGHASDFKPLRAPGW